MMVLVDTSVWSLALRRKQADLSPAEEKLKISLQELVQDGRAQIVESCPEPSLKAGRKVREMLRAFDEPQLGVEDYEEAARMNNVCRTRGIAGSPVDFLICAVPPSQLAGLHDRSGLCLLR